MYNNSYKNSSFFNHINRNIVYPTLFYDPMPLHNDAHTGVEIIEITSNDELDVEEYKTNDECTTNHANNRKTTFENNFTHNITPEEVKYIRCKQKHNFETCEKCETAFNRACTEFYGINCNERDDELPANRVFSFNSNSSSDVPDDMKTRFSDTTSDECWNSDESYNSHKAYDVNKKSNKQSIWNDCQKDMHYLFQNYNSYGPSQETSFSSSAEEDEPISNNIIHRIATPISTYLPRLNLPSSPTLPTVTEVFESSKSPINFEGNNGNSTTASLHKSVNNWFNSDQDIEINNKNFKHSNRLSTLLERENRKMKLKEVKEQEVLQKEHLPAIIEKTEISCSLQEIDKRTSENLLNDTNAANLQLQVAQRKLSPFTLSTKLISDPMKSDEENKRNCKNNENSNESDEVIEVYDCDLNTTTTQHDESFKQDIVKNNLLTKNKCNLTDRFSTNSVPPLHFSFVVDTDSENKSCFKRILMLIRCCK